jgi:hypothetical protein
MSSALVHIQDLQQRIEATGVVEAQTYMGGNSSSIVMPTFVLGHFGRVIAMNSAFLQRLGYTEQDYTERLMHASELIDNLPYIKSRLYYLRGHSKRKKSF